MAVDQTKIKYSNTWDIDQLLATSTVAVGIGNTAIYTIPASVPLPEFEVQFQPTGSTFWYQEGRSSSNGTLAGILDFYSYISAGSIFIHAPSTGTARYFVWADKIDY